MQSKIVREIDERKYRIVKFLANLYFISGIIALSSYIMLFMTARERFTPMHYYIWAFIALFLIGISYIRFYLIDRNAKLSYSIIATMMLIPAIGIMLMSGTTSAIPFILIITILLSSGIIFGLERTYRIFYIVVAFYLTTYFLHTFEIIPIRPFSTKTDLANTLMFLFFVWIIIRITRIGYDEIEFSYNKAIESSKKLERLNKNLDKKVKLRTRQLEKSLEDKANTIHAKAIIGSIAKPLLHDLSTPLSSIKIALQSMSKHKITKPIKDLLVPAQKATTQMERVIVNGRILMQKKELYSEFSPEKTISRVVEILGSELNGYGIQTTQEVSSKAKLIGSEVVFERMVINILLNAIEELKNCKKKEILIKGSQKDNYFILEITDSGNGIKRSLLPQIFSPDFSLKRDKGNLGLGLPFVESMIEKQFGGEISARSKVGEYTTFELKFDTTFSEKKSQKGSSVPLKSKSQRTLKGK